MYTISVWKRGAGEILHAKKLLAKASTSAPRVVKVNKNLLDSIRIVQESAARKQQVNTDALAAVQEQLTEILGKHAEE